MASVNYLKCKGAGHAKAMMRHSEKEERLKHEHSNPDIDKSCTEKNSSLYGLSYDEMCAKLDDRIRTLDETTNTNKRSDRVTMFSLEYSVPEGLPVWLEREYLADCEKVIAQQYGEHNIIESERHMDEKHRYVDHGVEKMSRAHGHTFVVPEIDGKLNGKKFSSKSQMMKLNKSIEEMSVQKYHLHFMTGKEARHQSVEELKRESAIEQQEISIQKNNEILQRQYETSQGLKVEKEELTHELTDLRDNFEAQKHDQAQYELEQARLEAEYAEKKKLIAEREAKLAQREKAIEGRELKPDELTALEQKTFWSSEDKQNVLKTAQLSAKHTQEVKALKRENKSLKQDVEAMKPKYQDYDRVQSQVRHRDDKLIPELERKVEKLEQDLKVRDDFIDHAGIKSQFRSFCQEIGYKLKEAVQEMSHSLRMR